MRLPVFAPVLRAAPFGLLLAATPFLGACQSLQSSDSFLGVITPYRVEVVQGNIITKEQAALVKTGMSRSQVRDILGSPLLADPFHADRWDYVFTIKRQGAESQLRRVKASFIGESLTALDTGGELPSEQDFVASIDTFKTARNAPPLELSAEEVKALPVPPPVPAVAAEPIGPTRTFPPLEPRP